MVPWIQQLDENDIAKDRDLCEVVLGDVCPLLLEEAFRDDGQDDVGSALLHLGPALINIVIGAIARVYHDTNWDDDQEQSYISYGLHLLCELLSSQDLQGQLLQDQARCELLLDVFRQCHRESTTITTIQSTIIELCRVLAVDGSWRHVLGAGGCIKICRDIALAHITDAGIQARALMFLYLMCFDDDNVENLMQSQVVILILKVSPMAGELT